MKHTRTQNLQAIIYLIAVVSLALFLGSGFIPREKDNLDNFVPLQEWAVRCEVDGIPFTAHYVSKSPKPLSYEIGLCHQVAKQFR